jgi:hypothetical protein
VQVAFEEVDIRAQKVFQFAEGKLLGCPVRFCLRGVV